MFLLLALAITPNSKYAAFSTDPTNDIQVWDGSFTVLGRNVQVRGLPPAGSFANTKLMVAK